MTIAGHFQKNAVSMRREMVRLHFCAIASPAEKSSTALLTTSQLKDSARYFPYPSTPRIEPSARHSKAIPNPYRAAA